MKRALLGVLLLLGLLAVVADRVAEQVAEGVIARQLRADLGTTPSVEIGGFPFLTQALRGRYGEIRVSAETLERGDVAVQDFTATLRGAQVPLSSVLEGSLDEVPVDRLEGGGLVTWAELEAAAGDRLRLGAAGEQVRITGTVPVLGQEVEAGALADATVQGQDLQLRATEVTVDGQPVSGVLGQAVVGALSVSYPVPELPYGLELRDVDITPEGVVATGVSEGAVLRR